jgi:DTW domain-containing protein YfiP
VSRRGNAAVRCCDCRLHLSLCLCDRMPRIETRTRLLLVIHCYEDRKTTNTGRLAARCLVGSEVHVRGQIDRPSEAPLIAPGTQPLMLYPYADAQPIEHFAGSAQPFTLIVPDGTWRQASRVRSRVPGLADVPAASVRGAATRYKLRAESHPDGLATIEAVARALGVLDGPAVQRALEAVFETLVERTRWSRGELDEAEMQTGLPPGALRHDPLSGWPDREIS